MPIVLRVLCTVLSLLLVVHAALTPFVEEGLLFLLPVAIDAGLLWLLWAFSRRRPGTSSLLSTISIVTVVCSLLFSPFFSEYGAWALAVRTQSTVETATWLALFFVLRMQSTKSWFNSAPENPSTLTQR